MFYHGAARIGAITVCVPGAYKKDEMKEVVKNSPSCMVVTSDELRSQLPEPEAIPLVSRTMVVEHDQTFKSILRGVSPCSDKPPASNTGDDTCAILLTGGTTGIPKGAMLTHRNLLYSAQNVAFHERMVPDDVGLCFLPLNHVFAQCHIMHTYFCGCGTLVLFPGFDMDKVVSADERTLIEFCRERMARYKVPKAIHFVADLPKTPQGKILRRELRKNVKQYTA